MVAASHPLATRTSRAASRVLEALGVSPGSLGPDCLPFGPGDVTAGTESELQTAVAGPRRAVDLPRVIEDSNFFQNVIKRHRRGELSRRVITDLERYLAGNREEVWENSWVRLSVDQLSEMARATLTEDLCADKSDPQSPARSDAGRFVLPRPGGDELRLPMSYLLKLALAEVLGSQENAPGPVSAAGRRMMGHFLSDNTSPETFSFYVQCHQPGHGLGAQVARENGLRYLICQLLTQFAGRRFELIAGGQRPLVYSAPTPPARQRELNEAISDSFYRELFMSPCLSGWDRGEEKHRYMHLCHQVLSRSQLNAVAKLKEAGIINSNLVVLPRTSNTSLANNGTHISLGSRRLSQAVAQGAAGLAPEHEECLADVVIKGVEHFLPLFVGAYSAAPTRLAFRDFHPERVLSFLPHELDYTHLRMIWRRWKKKAKLGVFGRPLTPFGPVWLDNTVAGVFRLKGDYISDYRLLDYLAALLSTHQSPALDGMAGNRQRLLDDLAEEGVFDAKMAVYLLYRQREQAVAGYSGFEGRHYSLFHGLSDDLAAAADLQAVITAMCYRYALTGRLSHALIPDGPELESERRQIFFGAAVGVPTFFVRLDTPNLFLKMIVERARRVRRSRRYPGYLRVYNLEYRKALVGLIREDAQDLVEAMDAGGLMEDLADRLEDWRGRSAAGRLTRGILEELGAKTPLDVPAAQFNQAAERYYRGRLRREHTREALARISRNGRQDQGVALDVVCPNFRELDDYLGSLPPDAPSRLLAMDGVSNPQNFGMIVRVATAAGLDGILCADHANPAPGPLVIKASAGILFRSPLLRCGRLPDALAACAANDHALWLLDAGAKDDVFAARQPERVVMVLGSETDGISGAVRALPHRALMIPMSAGVESLNVATSAALLAYASRLHGPRAR